jgi:hypothetical protein
MAQDCDQPDYNKLVQALCTEANVNLITVPASKTLGEWCGLCKLDAEGLARKVVGCSFVVIKVRARARKKRACAHRAAHRAAQRACALCRATCVRAHARVLPRWCYVSASLTCVRATHRTTGRSPRRWALFRST